MWSCGVWASEIMLAQVLTQLLVFVIQVGLLLLFGLVVFKLPLHGSLVLLFCICILLGITGMMFGLVIASKVSEERDAMQCALGSFFPALLLSGVMVRETIRRINNREGERIRRVWEMSHGERNRDYFHGLTLCVDNPLDVFSVAD